MRGRGLLFLSLVVFLGGLAPAFAHAQSRPTPSSSGPPTEVLILEPYTSGQLNRDLQISRTMQGLCDHPSQIDANRPDAWACSAGGKTYDPCFANQDNSQLACVDLPAVTSSSLSASSMLGMVVINPTEPLDPLQANTPGPDATPFLIELVDGQFCIPEPKDVRFASVEIYGYCTAGYWFGPGDLSQSLWTLPILQRTASDSLSSITHVGVRRVWY